jgi:DNA-binding response OmpR family regulator
MDHIDDMDQLRQGIGLMAYGNKDPLTEYKIVKMLMERRGVVPRNLLLEVLWDDGSKFIDDNTLSVHMSRLREKIGAEHIKTIRGVGYQWSDT